MHGSHARLLFTQLSALSHLFIDILTHNPQQIVKIQGPCHFVNQSESSIAKGSDERLMSEGPSHTLVNIRYHTVGPADIS